LGLLAGGELIGQGDVRLLAAKRLGASDTQRTSSELTIVIPVQCMVGFGSKAEILIAVGEKFCFEGNR
jgi:hypothetical protein